MSTMDLSKAALLVMDFQTAVVGMTGVGEDAITRTKKVINAARTAGVHVIYVRVAFSPGYAEVNQRNRQFAPIAASGLMIDGDPSADVDPRLAPATGDTIISKHRVSAFHDTNLRNILDEKGIDTLILMGISTSGVVLSTLRQASDMDYQIHVVSDCCIDPDLEVHQCLIERVFPAQADILEADKLIALFQN